MIINKNNGESIAEALIAILIISMAVIMILSSTLLSSKLISGSENLFIKVLDKENDFNTLKKFNSKKNVNLIITPDMSDIENVDEQYIIKKSKKGIIEYDYSGQKIYVYKNKK